MCQFFRFSKSLCKHLNLSHFPTTDFCQILYTIFRPQSINSSEKVKIFLSRRICFSDTFKRFHIALTLLRVHFRVAQPVITPCSSKAWFPFGLFCLLLLVLVVHTNKKPKRAMRCSNGNIYKKPKRTIKSKNKQLKVFTCLGF